MNIDNEGLLYYDESDKGKEILFKNDAKKRIPNDVSKFYQLLQNSDLIIKYSINNLDNEKVRYMLRRFLELKNKVQLTDLPTSYYVEDGIMHGTVIHYYQDAPSLDSIFRTHQLGELKKYYMHDDDNIHNLFMLLSDIISIIEELKDNEILYIDSNPGNFVLFNNQAKLIDFDPSYNRIRYGNDKHDIREVLKGIEELVFLANKRFGLYDLYVSRIKSFDAMRKHLVKVENKVRKRR